MLQINLEELDIKTQDEYKKFQVKVNRLLKEYKRDYPDKFQEIEDEIANAHEWDSNIELASGNSSQIVNTSQLLAFEYCLGIERITKGKVSFTDMKKRLFNEVQKFKIGNPEKGIDDECLYGKTFDDKTAIPVTAKEYRLVMGAGAQHLNYVKNGVLTGAVFIYEKGESKGIAADEKGQNPEDKETSGIDFKDLRKGQPLLDNLRQTAFHEWTHAMEQEILKKSEEFEHEYYSNGKKYRNYQKVKKYFTAENIGDFDEPEYHYEDYIDKEGNNKRRYYYEENGQKKYIEKNPFVFELQPGELNEEICISTGLETQEVLDNGELKKHNIVTEGFVEKTARATVRAIDENAELDEGKYPEYVEIANQVIVARDAEKGEGQTYADFVTHSSTLKRDLETRTVTKEDGTEVDGLHYISDYADKVQVGETDKAKFLIEKNMIDICTYLKLSEAQIEAIKESEFFEKQTLTEEEQKQLISLFIVGKNPDNKYVESKVEEYVGILDKEKEFFDTIPEKLGYRERTTMAIASEEGLEQMASGRKGCDIKKGINEIKDNYIEMQNPDKNKENVLGEN